MNIKKMNNTQLKEEVENILSFITTDYEEEAAAEVLLNNKDVLEDIRNDVSEGTSLIFAVRQALQTVIERCQTMEKEECALEYGFDSYDDNDYNVHSRYGAMYMHMLKI